MSTENPLRRLHRFGQSVWLDYIQRGMLTSGEVTRLIAQDALTGMTTNPAIFENAITQHHDYDAAIAALALEGRAVAEIYEALVVEDVGRAADLLRPTYEESGGRDGYVSLEVTPHIAYDTEATIVEAQRLWRRVARPNLMIKVPATQAGLQSIRRLIALGVNVNVTLLFGVARYREVAAAWMAGLEDRLAAGAPLAGVASVASFFLSRIDTHVDHLLDEADGPAVRALRGQTAIACARLAYQEYKALTAGRRWQTLAANGVKSQRLLWASTSTKDRAYHDLKYVEALIGSETVNTLTPETLAAYRNRGEPADRLEEDLDVAGTLPERLAALGVDLETVSAELELQGVRKFVESFDRLHAALEGRGTRPPTAQAH
ncbi:MAG: transaldolase [Steroidobacteraceae bacterium]|jgi:transaldolase